MRTFALFSLVAVAACAPQVSTGSSKPVASAALTCQPTTGDLANGASLTGLTGDHRIRLMTGSGRSTTGTVHFNTPANGSSAGTGTVVLDSVGAVAPGNASVVTAVQWNKPGNGSPIPAITIRFGTTMPGQIEASYTALQLTSLTASTFAGTWASAPGGASSVSASGYFCAARLSP